MLVRALLTLVVLVGLATGAVWWTHRDLAPATVEAAYVAPSDRFVSVPGLRVRVRIEGPETAPPLVLLHGFTDSLETWDAWAELLADDYRVIRFDLPGHGLTGPDPEMRYGADGLPVFVAAVLDALGVERAHIAGNSMGGLAAWRFAAAYPDRVDKLVLVDPDVFADDAQDPPPPLAILFRMAPTAGVRFVYSLAVADADAITPENVARVRAMWRRRGNGGAMVDTLRAFATPYSSEGLGRIRAPTLILWGARDRLIPLEDGRRAAAIVPGAQLVVYDDLGHMPHLEAPVRSAEDVRAFLEGS